MAFTVAGLLQPPGDGAPPHTRGMVRRRTTRSSGTCLLIRAATSAPAAVRRAPPAARASFHLVRPLDSLLPIQASAVTRSGGTPACLLCTLPRLLYGIQSAQATQQDPGFPHHLFILELNAHHGRPVVLTATRRGKRQVFESAAAIPVRATLGAEPIAHPSIITAPSIRVRRPSALAWGEAPARDRRAHFRPPCLMAHTGVTWLALR
jgi:hypothetical protein